MNKKRLMELAGVPTDNMQLDGNQQLNEQGGVTISTTGQLKQALSSAPDDLPLRITVSDDVESGTAFVYYDDEVAEIVGSAEDV